MEKWQICEKECLEFLKINYSDKKYNFEAEGGSDSTKSDILLTKSGIAIFYLETKMQNAQCGQFVVFPNDDYKTFDYSKANAYKENHQSQIILEKMAEDYDRYKNPGTDGIELKMDKAFFYDWIMEFYRNKGVKYFIIEKEVGENNLSASNFVIFPLEHFYKYFDVNALYRRKKSGSANPSEKDFFEIEKAMNSEGFKKIDIWKDEKYVLVKMQAEPMTYKLIGKTHTYQFKHENDNVFKVTKLSNTSNPNVIFSIALIKEQEQRDLDKFNAEFK